MFYGRLTHHEEIVSQRPKGLTALGAFFIFGAAMSFTAGVGLLFPNGPLEPMWRLNPRAREGFGRMGLWAVVLMFAVCIACSFAAAGLWRGAVWGHRLAIGVLVLNLLGDAINALSGLEPRAALGVPIAGALVAYLVSDSVRAFFAAHEPGVTRERRRTTGWS